jgi:hypothetical protein
LDHDDQLHPHALLEIVRCLNDFPDTDLIYSDEDKLTMKDAASHPPSSHPSIRNDSGF